MSTPTWDAYAVLGVDPAADDATIAAAYRGLARRYHPDIAGETATRRMMRINAAWDRVRDPERRAEYDEELAEVDPVRATASQRRPTAHHAPASEPEPAPAPAPTFHAASDASHTPYQWPAERDGTGAAGRPPGRPLGTVLPFGRHLGWSLGEIARTDPGYLVWLEGRHEGKPYLEEIDSILRRSGFRTTAEPTKKKGRFER